MKKNHKIKPFIAVQRGTPKVDVAESLARQSKQAVCGVGEREVMVPKHKVMPSVKALEKKGFYVVGTSYGNTPMKKIWFIRRGSL